MTAISVNGVPISEDAIAREAQYHPAPCRDTALAMATNALVVRELLLQEARANLPHAGASDEDTLIQGLMDANITTPDADEAACRRYYANNLHLFRTPTLYEAAHIFYPAPSEHKKTRQEAEDRATATIAALTENPTVFEDLAKAQSACPTREEGGRLGQVTGREIVPEMETYLAELEEGQICPVPVKTRYGVHVVRLDRRAEGECIPFEDVKERIAAYLVEASWCRAVSQYVQLLVGKAYIQGWNCEQATSPLVQ